MSENKLNICIPNKKKHLPIIQTDTQTYAHAYGFAALIVKNKHLLQMTK